jgi:hypothetical protein
MTLAKKTWWERYDRPRYLQSEIEDMIEVELEDEIALEGDRDECAIGSGEVLVSAVWWMLVHPVNLSIRVSIQMFNEL